MRQEEYALKVSIVIPVYNVRRSLLSACLASVGGQTLRAGDHEIIVVDDCSTDTAIVAEMENFVARHANRRLIRHSTNRGLNQARMTGVRSAKGSFILFVDGDDVLTRDAAELLYIEAQRANADVVSGALCRWNPETLSYGPSLFYDEKYPQPLPERMRAIFSGFYPFTMCGRLFRRSILRDSVFDIPIGLLREDMTTTVRALLRAYRVASTSTQIYYYTIRDGSITSSFSQAHIDGYFYGFSDWIDQLNQREMFDELEPYLRLGVEKMVNHCVLGCIRATNLSLQEKQSMLADIGARYDALPILRAPPTLPGTMLLARLAVDGVVGVDDENAQRVQRAIAHNRLSLGRLHHGVEPSDVARRLKDKVVIIGQADYQVRNAARLARALRQRGLPCVVIDNSAVADEGRRRLKPEDRELFWRTEYVQVKGPRYGPDWLSTARLVVAFNDLSPNLREALEFRHLLGLPSVSMVEGINDFRRVDFEELRQLPYRRCDDVFLAGDDDAKYFTDRRTHVIGLPVVEALAVKQPEFPEETLAVLNVNFTYGSLGGKRTEFVRAAQEAFDELGIKWQITQHPMDNGDLAGLPLSDRSQEELIDACSVFVSRFATGILEALASGKPVVYFNPHGERVLKFSEPRGAFEIARSSGELVDAIRRVQAEIASGVEFRERATPFLRHHAGYRLDDGHDVGGRFAQAVIALVDRDEEAQLRASTHFLERLDAADRFAVREPGLALGVFERSHRARLNEEELIGRYFGCTSGLMVDVGANFGNSLDIYLGKGWTVHAFEPDPANREKLRALWPECDRLIINSEAVTDRDDVMLPFYASDESTGISSLAPFTSGHHQVAEVSTTTLSRYLAAAKVDHVNFLKVDVEGFDKFVLDGFPWDRDMPDVVLVEFEDVKTSPLGYQVGDLACMLEERSYYVYVSEWHPVLRYGSAHDWRCLRRFDPAAELSSTWGNLIGFRTDPGEERLQELAVRSVKFGVIRPAEPPAQRVVREEAPASLPVAQSTERVIASSAPQRRRRLVGARLGRSIRRSSQRWYALVGRWRRAFAARRLHARGWLYRELANGVREVSPSAFRVGQAFAWVARGARRHKGLTALLVAAIVGSALLPLISGMWRWRAVLWSVGGACLVAAAFLALVAIGREVLRRYLRQHRSLLARQHRELLRRFDRSERAHAEIVARQAESLNTKVTEAAADAAWAVMPEVRRQIRLESSSVQLRLDKAIENLTLQSVASGRSQRPLRGSIDALSRSLGRSLKRLVELEKETEGTTRSGYNNRARLAAHERRFRSEDLARIRTDWLPRFGLSYNDSQLMDIAHDVCRAEDWSERRLATTVQAAVLRSLALVSLGAREIDILEIGTLFGVGAGTLYRSGVGNGQCVHLTLVDPSSGYYDVQSRDVTTGASDSLEVMMRNLRAMSVPESDVRVIAAKSGEEHILATAADRLYDYVLVDGDHSAEAVAADIARYGDLVRPGGLLIFDGYGAPEGPQIKMFVDAHYRSNPKWLWIGDDWSTAIVARRDGFE